MIAGNEHHDDGRENSRLLTVADLSRRLRISIRQTRKLKAEGSLPNPIRLGRSIRWRASEIAAWIEAGCPSCEVWKQRLESVRADE